MSYKVTFKGRKTNEIKEVRRFVLDHEDENAALSLAGLKEKLVSLFSALEGKEVLVSWVDDDGDRVSIKDDEDLRLALCEMTGPVYRLTVEIDAKREAECRRKEILAKLVHPGIICDGCDGKVAGLRFKCMACPDYDLCSVCQEKQLHSHHNMRVIELPQIDDMLHPFQAFRAASGGRRSGRCRRGGFWGPPAAFRPCLIKPEGCRQKQKEEAEKPANEEAQDQVKTGASNKQTKTTAKDNFFNIIGNLVSDALIPFVIDMSEEVLAAAAEKENDDSVTSIITSSDVTTTTTAADTSSKPQVKETEDSEKKTSMPTTMPEKANMATINASSELIAAAASEKPDEPVLSVAEGSDEGGWTLYPVLPQQETSVQAATADDAADATANNAAISTPLSSVVDDPKIKVAVEAMKNMGFTDENGWLTNLLVAKGGDIGRVLDLIRPSN